MKPTEIAMALAELLGVTPPIPLYLIPDPIFTLQVSARHCTACLGKRRFTLCKICNGSGSIFHHRALVSSWGNRYVAA